MTPEQETQLLSQHDTLIQLLTDQNALIQSYIDAEKLSDDANTVVLAELKVNSDTANQLLTDLKTVSSPDPNESTYDFAQLELKLDAIAENQVSQKQVSVESGWLIVLAVVLSFAVKLFYDNMLKW